MSAGPTFSARRPQGIEFELRATFSLEEWRNINAALEKGCEGFWGPTRILREAISSMVSQATRVFQPETEEQT